MKLRMFKAEKMALLILAIAVAIWCVVSLCTRGVNTLSPPTRQYSADTIAPVATPDTARGKEKEKKKRKGSSSKGKSRRKASRKQTPAPKQRDHLREPVDAD